MCTDLAKIQQLIATTDLNNIRLALQLAEGNGIELQLEGFRTLYAWLGKHERTFYVQNEPLSIELMLQHLFQLSEIDIDMLGIKEIPPLLGQLQQIESLTIQQNRLHEIPTCVYALSNLKFLSISSNYIGSVSSEITKLKALTYFSLIRNRLEHIPSGILSLQNLKVLNLRRNQIKELPKGIANLEKLERLILTDNPITDLRPLLALQQLKYLHVDFYNIPRAQLIALKRKFPALVFS